MVAVNRVAPHPGRKVQSAPHWTTYRIHLFHTHFLQFVQLVTMANCALRCVSPVPTTPHATPGPVTVSVCLAGPRATAPQVSL